MTTHYHTVATLIEWLREHRATQPRLEDLAAVANMSPMHLQRVFSAWAGISPKRFLQVLNRDFLLQRLCDGGSVESAAMDAGLSTGSRAYDLMVTLDAVTPGETRTGGAGLQLRYGLHETPFGTAMITCSQRGICDLVFLDEPVAAAGASSVERELSRIRARWHAADLQRDDTATGDIAAAINTQCRTGRFRLAVSGSNFQIKVWEALLRIPEGQVATYQRIAEAIGQPTAARAVGNAVGANPVAWLIPCHRVIRGSGVTGDYRWGASRKAAMLVRELAGEKDTVTS